MTIHALINNNNDEKIRSNILNAYKLTKLNKYRPQNMKFDAMENFGNIKTTLISRV
jgi:hypothetical protein